MNDQSYPYPLELISTGVEILTDAKAKKNSFTDPLRYLLCYCLKPTKNGYLVLNRDYKPLGLTKNGINSSGWADYDIYPFLCYPEEKLDLSPLEKVNGLGGTAYYFFSDSTYPRNPKLIDRYIRLIEEVFLA